MKAYEGSQAVKGTSESKLKQEILLLKKENESLRNELRRRDLLIGSSDVENPFMGSFGSNFDQNPVDGIICRNCPEVPGDLLQNSSQYEKKDEKSSFQLPTKRHLTRSNRRSPPGSPLIRMRIDTHVWHALTLKNSMYLKSKAKLNR